MTQKNIIIGVVLLALVAGIVYFANPKNMPEEAPATESTQETSTQAPAATETPQEESNLNAACDGALAYMSFPDGASADAFVAECKDGKHPEVLQQYEAQMNSDTSVSL